MSDYNWIGKNRCPDLHLASKNLSRRVCRRFLIDSCTEVTVFGLCWRLSVNNLLLYNYYWRKLIWNNEQRVSIPSSFIDSDQESTFESINLRPNVEYVFNRKITIKLKKMYIWASGHYSLRYVFRNDGGLKKRHNFWLARNERKRKKWEKSACKARNWEIWKPCLDFCLRKICSQSKEEIWRPCLYFFWWWNNIQIKAMEKVADFFFITPDHAALKEKHKTQWSVRLHIS